MDHIAPKKDSEPERRVTMKDIAKRLRVHPSTVSMALRNSAEISPEMKGKVKTLAEKMGYRPDPALALFVSRRLGQQVVRHHSSVAFVTDHGEKSEINSFPALKETYDSIVVTASRMGYQVDYFNVGSKGLTAMRLDGILRSRNISAVILAHISPRTSSIPLDWSRLSAVRIDSLHLESQLDVFSPNYRHGIQLGMEHLSRHGFVRPGMAIKRSEDVRLKGMWRAGYLSSYFHLIGDVSPEVLLFEESSKSVEAGEVAHWLSRNRFDSILTDDPGLHRALAAEFPNLAFVLLDPQSTNNGLPCVVADWALLAENAMQLLSHRWQNNDTGAGTYTSVIYNSVHWEDGAFPKLHTKRRSGK